jgi:hypothetical protein
MQRDSGGDMKGSPRSIMLTWANRAAGWWNSAAANAIRQQQNAFLNAMAPKPGKTRPKRRRATKRRAS